MHFYLTMRKTYNKITNALNTEDLWKLMLRRVPPIVSEYFRGGADNEITMRANVRAFQQSLTTAHGALNFPNLDMSTTVAGQKIKRTMVYFTGRQSSFTLSKSGLCSLKSSR